SEPGRTAFLGNDLADAGDWHSGDCGWNLLRDMRGQEQFVIFAAVESGSEYQRIFFLARGHGAGMRQIAWNGLMLQKGCNAALCANMFHVSGKTIADIDHGGCSAMFAQPLANFNARLREIMGGGEF